MSAIVFVPIIASALDDDPAFYHLMVDLGGCSCEKPGVYARGARAEDYEGEERAMLAHIQAVREEVTVTPSDPSIPPYTEWQTRPHRLRITEITTDHAATDYGDIFSEFDIPISEEAVYSVAMTSVADFDPDHGKAVWLFWTDGEFYDERTGGLIPEEERTESVNVAKVYAGGVFDPPHDLYYDRFAGSQVAAADGYSKCDPDCNDRSLVAYTVQTDDVTHATDIKLWAFDHDPIGSPWPPSGELGVLDSYPCHHEDFEGNYYYEDFCLNFTDIWEEREQPAVAYNKQTNEWLAVFTQTYHAYGADGEEESLCCCTIGQRIGWDPTETELELRDATFPVRCYADWANVPPTVASGALDSDPDSNGYLVWVDLALVWVSNSGVVQDLSEGLPPWDNTNYSFAALEKQSIVPLVTTGNRSAFTGEIFEGRYLVSFTYFGLPWDPLSSGGHRKHAAVFNVGLDSEKQTMNQDLQYFYDNTYETAANNVMLLDDDVLLVANGNPSEQYYENMVARKQIYYILVPR